jgi:uncharacterized iron-regulated membrane protein
MQRVAFTCAPGPGGVGSRGRGQRGGALEFYEWVIKQVNPAGVSVGYTDSVVDLFAGMLGSLTVGGLVLWWARRRGAERDPPPSAGRLRGVSTRGQRGASA